MILYTKWSKYRDRFTTFLELMKMHRSKFKVMSSINDLLCYAKKDYKESLAVV